MVKSAKPDSTWCLIYKYGCYLLFLTLFTYLPGWVGKAHRDDASSKGASRAEHIFAPIGALGVPINSLALE